jgi:hypothetical protein
LGVDDESAIDRRLLVVIAQLNQAMWSCSSQHRYLSTGSSSRIDLGIFCDCIWSIFVLWHSYDPCYAIIKKNQCK